MKMWCTLAFLITSIGKDPTDPINTDNSNSRSSSASDCHPSPTTNPDDTNWRRAFHTPPVATWIFFWRDTDSRFSLEEEEARLDSWQLETIANDLNLNVTNAGKSKAPCVFMASYYCTYFVRSFFFSRLGSLELFSVDSQIWCTVPNLTSIY